jgi:RNA polymerase sigma factor (sigma-70 family)
METNNNKIPVIAHPLRGRRKPGPQRGKQPPPGETDLKNAQRILELIDAGVLVKEKGGTPLPVPCDKAGRPRRRLTIEDERELARRIQVSGDIEARNVLVLANLGLVYLTAKQMKRPHLRYEDLVQEGTMGLLRATETFDAGRGVRFSTYCVYWIRAKIQRYLQRLERDDVPIISGSAMEVDYRGRRRRPRAPKLSMELPLDGDEDRTIANVISSQEVDPEAASLRSEIERRVVLVLTQIAEQLGDPRLHMIIHCRLIAEEPETLSMLGSKLNLSREGARLLETKILTIARERLCDLAKAHLVKSP